MDHTAILVTTATLIGIAALGAYRLGKRADHLAHPFSDSDIRTQALAGMLPAATTNDVGEGRTEAQRPARTGTEIAPHSKGIK